MSSSQPVRAAAWTPPPRPEWVSRVNQEGSFLDIRSVVPLDENSLLATARQNTGLDDFGPEDWITPFRRLIQSLDEEANHNFLGRVMTRSDLLIYLEARLQIQDWYNRHPEIADEEIAKPILILGQGRAGTSGLIHLLSKDPDNATLLTWEMMFPCPPPEAATYATDARIEMADRLTNMRTRICPELAQSQLWAGDLPTEMIYLRAISFMAPIFFDTVVGQVPSYSDWALQQDFVPVFEYEKKILKLLQWRNPRRHWILKDPASISFIPQILQVYPDIGFVWCHRDPVQALSSMVSIIGRQTYVRTDQPFASNFRLLVDAEGAARALNRAIDWIEQGVLPKERLCSVHYGDYAADPMSAVEQIYRHFGIAMTDRARAAMQRYTDENPRSARPAHRYDTGPAELISEERRAFARYQSYFNVPTEL